VRLETARVAARAHGTVVVDPDVADVPGAAAGTAVDRAVDDDAAANAGADLDEEQVVDGSSQPGVHLPERHDVDVVVDEHRAPEML
jgi:hypothetical protein